MFRFTIRDVLALTGIAAVSCVAGVVIWRADTAEELAGVFWLFVFGAVCYAIGSLLKRSAKSEYDTAPEDVP